MSTSKRTFGVEIECGHESLDQYSIMDRLGQEGYDTGYSPTETRYGVSRDGSGIEVSTRILTGEKGYRELTNVMDFLSDLGCYISRRDGMHVHVGAHDFKEDEEACRTLARTWYNNQALIGRMCASHRYSSNYCTQLTEKQSQRLGQEYGKPYQGKRPKDWGDRYKGLNFASIPDNGTIEFRLHEGCLDPRKAIAWVKFCQRIVDYSYDERKVLTCATSKTKLLNALDVPEDAAALLWPRQKRILPRRKYRRSAKSS